MLSGLAAVGLCSSAVAQRVGPEFQVNTYTTSSQTSPSVASDSNGNFVVVWQSDGQDGSYGGVFGQRYDADGTALGGEFQVNTYTWGTQGLLFRPGRPPTVNCDPNGNFVVVWESDGQDGSGSGVFGQLFDNGGNRVGGEFMVNTYTTGLQRASSVASDAGGNFVVVWHSYGQDGNGSGVFGRRYDSGGSPLTGEFQVNTHTASAQTVPFVASSPGGNFVVVWESSGQDGSYTGVFGQRYDNGGSPVGGEFQVNAYTTLFQEQPAVAYGPADNFVVVWRSFGQDGSMSGIYSQRYDGNGDPLDAEFRVNTYTTSDQDQPMVASDADGNFVVVWQSKGQDGSKLGVFGRRFAHDGQPLGDDFQVNEYTTSVQSHPYVSSDSAGELVVVWDSYGQDGTSSVGVFGQRLAALPSLSVADVAVKEGKPRTGKGIFVPVRLSGVSTQTVTVDYATADGSASAGSDYIASSGKVTFAPGQTLKTIVILIRGDGKVEGDETFFVNLSNSTNATLGDSQALVTILNDDPVAVAPDDHLAADP